MARQRAGILPGARDRGAVRGRRDRAAQPLRCRPDPAGEPRPPARRRRLSRARELPARARRSPSPSGSTTLKLHEIDLAGGAVLETRLRLHRAAAGEPGAARRDLAAAANPKSSTGRLDIFTRVITDRGAGLRHDSGRLPRPALCRGQPAHLPDHRARRLAPVADPLPPRQCPPRRRRAASRSTRRTPLVDGEPQHRRRPGAVDRPRRRRATASSATAPSATPA